MPATDPPKLDRWIVIPRWDEFQHRDMARSTIPPWVKNMTRLLHDDDYLDLSLSQRGLLHGLWLLYASHRRVLSEAIAKNFLSPSAAEAKHWRRNIQALSDAGYVQVSASRPARHEREPASLEVEVEEKDLALKGPTSNGNGAAFAERVASESRREHRPYDPPTDSEGRIRALIARRVIADLVDLDVELRSGDHRLSEQTVANLRALFTEAA